MINLLLPADQRAIRTEYRRRLWMVVGSLSLIWLIVVLIVAGSLYLFISWRRLDAMRALASAKQELLGQNAEQLTLEIKTANDHLKILVPSKRPPPSEVIARLIASRGLVVLQKISYAVIADEISVEIAGRAPNRQDFLRYLEFLESDSSLTQVNSPVRNLIREKNLSFTLDLRLR